VLEKQSTVVTYPGGGMSSPPVPVAIDAATQQKAPIAFPGSPAFSLAINLNNQVALGDGNGTSYIADFHGNRVLPAPPGYTKIAVQAINASGQTIGVAARLHRLRRWPLVQDLGAGCGPAGNQHQGPGSGGRQWRHR
jgi:hypothetical protein